VDRDLARKPAFLKVRRTSEVRRTSGHPHLPFKDAYATKRLLRNGVQREVNAGRIVGSIDYDFCG